MKQKFQEIINKNIRDYIDPMQKIQKNVINLNTGNTLEHELKKSEIAYKCIKDGLTILTEPKLKNIKRRPDIMVICTHTPIVYEIVHSESDSSIKNKVDDFSKYGIKVIRVDA